MNRAKVTGTLANARGPLDFVTTLKTIRKLISNEVEKNKKVTKPRHPEMVSYGDALDISTGGYLNCNSEKRELIVHIFDLSSYILFYLVFKFVCSNKPFAHSVIAAVVSHSVT